MSLERKRGISTAQVKLRMLNFKVEDTATTPVAASFDRFQIASITDLGGTGAFTVIFSKPFERDCLPVGTAVFGEGAVAITAVAYDRVTVQVSDLAGTDANLDFSMCICGSDSRFDY